MGGGDSKVQEDYFLLDPLSKMTLKGRKTVSYYLLSEKDTASVLISQLRQFFKIDTFPSVTTLKQQMNFVSKNQIVKVILTNAVSSEDIDYLNSQVKIKQLIGFGLEVSGAKKGGRANNPQELIKILQNLEAKDSLQLPPSNMLFLTEEDTRNFNRYRLSYHCNINYANRKSAKQDLMQLAKKIYPQQDISLFDRQYDLELEGKQRNKMVLSWAFKNSFYWDLVTILTKNTTDPKRLAYIRLALKDIHQSITKDYISQKSYEPFSIIVQLTEDEENKIEKGIKHFIIFTSFIKGYSNEQKANAAFKKRKEEAKSQGKKAPYLFNVQIDRRDRDDKLDFGFIKNSLDSEQDIIVNIYNVFRVEEVSLKGKRGVLLLGELPIYEKMRQTEQARLGMGKIELDLIRNYDFLEDLMSKIDGQATILQMSGYYKDSLELYNKKVDFVRKSNDSQENINRCLIKKADALALCGQFQIAEQQYKSVSSQSKILKVISLIHLADMYMRNGEQQKLDGTINQIDPLLNVLQNRKEDLQDYFKGKHFSALRTFKNGQYKKAEVKLKELIKTVNKEYDYTIEGKPLVHDIYRTKAAVESKLGRHQDALDTLNTTLSWQLVCEGKTHNVALTQTLIQSVCRTSGNKEELTRSMERLEGMSSEIDTYQRRLASSTGVNLNQSMINLNTL